MTMATLFNMAFNKLLTCKAALQGVMIYQGIIGNIGFIGNTQDIGNGSFSGIIWKCGNI